MIANALRVEIERYAAKMAAIESSLLQGRRRHVTPVRMTAYLANVHHLVCHTPNLPGSCKEPCEATRRRLPRRALRAQVRRGARS